MNAALVSRTLSLIPDRVARKQSGSAFDPSASAACAHPERIAHLAQFLSWLGPLHPITKDDLRILGLMTPYGKPAVPLADEGDEEIEIDASEEALLAAEPQPLACEQIEATLP
ncbi:MAG TPA: hypothetical protein VGJ74_08535 [Burkholderiales bacterium]|jgi:hypothetical protein